MSTASTSSGRRDPTTSAFAFPQGWAGEYWQYLGIPHGLDAFEHQAWASGVKPLEIARDNYNFQLWMDEFASHGFFFKEPDGTLRLVRDAFASGLAETPWSEKLRADFTRWRSNPKVYDGPDLPRWLEWNDLRAVADEGVGARSGGSTIRGPDSRCRRGRARQQCDLGSVRRTVELARHAQRGGHQFTAAERPGAIQLVVPGWERRRSSATCSRSSSPRAIAGEGFAGILNGRLQFGEFDKPGNPTRIRLAATAIRVTNLPNGSVEVVYSVGGKLHKTTAKVS